MEVIALDIVLALPYIAGVGGVACTADAHQPVMIVGGLVFVALLVCFAHQYAGVVLEALLHGTVVTEFLTFPVIVMAAEGTPLGKPLARTFDSEEILSFTAEDVRSHIRLVGHL